MLLNPGAAASLSGECGTAQWPLVQPCPLPLPRTFRNSSLGCSSSHLEKSVEYTICAGASVGPFP